jgi:hypothetical protein
MELRHLRLVGRLAVRGFFAPTFDAMAAPISVGEMRALVLVDGLLVGLARVEQLLRSSFACLVLAAQLDLFALLQLGLLVLLGLALLRHLVVDPPYARHFVVIQRS